MNPKWIYAIFGIVLLSGMAFAISGATVDPEVERGKWAGNTSGSVTTEGGNVSGVNVSAGTSTEKWASFYGDVVGSIVLADSAATSVYSWTWATTEGGEVCVTQDQNYVWTNAETTTAALVDTAFGFAAADADSAANTLDDACTVDLNEAPSVASVGATLLSSYTTCAVGDGTESAEDDFAFCTDINGTGVNYEGVSADYELMVPTSDADAETETYYFFIELN